MRGRKMLFLFAGLAGLSVTCGAEGSATGVRGEAEHGTQVREGKPVLVLAPLRERAGSGGVAAQGVTGLEMDGESLREMRGALRLNVDDLPLGNGERVNCELKRMQVFAAGAKVVVGGADGVDREMPLPAVEIFSGTIRGEAGSRVFLSFSEWAVQGYVKRAGGLRVISSRRDDRGEMEVGVFDPKNVQWGAGVPFVCETDAYMAAKGMTYEPPQGGVGGVIVNPPCRVAHIALETDAEYSANLFGGNLHAAAAYAGTLMGAVSEIYTADVNVRIDISYLRLWDSPSDPWTGGSTGAQLDEFLAYWNANMGFVVRDAAHFLSGRGLGGGIAYLPGLCQGDFAYGVSANLGGSFPYPIQNNNGANWDLEVVAHELGHNFGSPHTHDYAPPIDNCGNGDCTGANLGTIMSYCHLCAGGIANMQMTLHPTVSQVILDYLNTLSCGVSGSGVQAEDDYASTIQGTPVTVDVLPNDIDVNCGPITLVGFDAVSAQGGTVQQVAGPQLRLTPLAGASGADTFSYMIQRSGTSSTATASVHVDVQALRVPENPTQSLPGVKVQYYALSAPSVLPDFSVISPFLTTSLTQVNVPSTGGVFANSGVSDNFGAVFTGFVSVPSTGVYTFYVESDDGSVLKVGAQTVVANDGLHGMVEKSGTIPLLAGTHAVRVEFFEAGGGAGVIARYEGPGVAKQVFPPSAWTRPVAADINADGRVNIDDLTTVILSWGACPGLPLPCPADIDGDGSVEIDDLTAIILSWG